MADQFNVRDSVKLFLARLTPTNNPDGLAHAYRDAVKGEETSTERIFLAAGGFSAWAAYFLTKRAAKSPAQFDGQAACNQMIESLEQTTSDTRRSLAKEVAQQLPPDIKLKFQGVFDKMTRSIVDDISVVPQKRPRTTDGDVGAPGPSISLVGPATSVSNTAQGSPKTSGNTGRFESGDAPVLRAATVFPTFLAGAICKQNNGRAWVAAVKMSFFDAPRPGHKAGSVMRIVVAGNKVERLASLLFDASVELAGKCRYLILPTGGRVVPCPELTLRGCKRGVISEVLGPDIDIAVKASRAYEEETEQGLPLTECVSMTFSYMAEDCALLTLSLDEKEAVRLRGKLYE